MKTLVLSVVVCAAPLFRAVAGSESLPSDVEIRQILADRIEVQHKSVGMVVGIITPEGRRIISYGQLNQGDPRPLNGDTVFEIGSVTKVFTALLLCDMVQRGEVQLADPAVRYLPSEARLAEHNGQSITLLDLATHTSGLPFFPSDIPLDDPARAIQIVAKYTPAQVYSFLSNWHPTREIGSKWEYSNLGFGLLGAALARRAGTDYESLLRTRITAPLGLESTAITISPSMDDRLARGHDDKLRPAPVVNMPAFGAAGSLRSSANDLLSFLASFLELTKSRLTPAMAAMIETRRPGPSFKQALGWWIMSFTEGDEGFVWHGGETPGFTSSVAFDPRSQVGVVVLSNSSVNDGGLCWHLMRSSYPMETSASEKARKERVEVAIDPKSASLYAGQYQVPSGPAAGMLITIEHQGANLIMKSATTPPEGLRLHATSERSFFITEADFRLDFQKDSEGRVTGLTIHFAGTNTVVPRLDPH